MDDKQRERAIGELPEDERAQLWDIHVLGCALAEDSEDFAEFADGWLAAERALAEIEPI